VQAGVSRHSVVLQDAGGRQSIAKFVGIEVQTYNHAPFFTVVNISAGQNTVPNEQEVVFAPMVSPGAPHEADQKLRYSIYSIYLLYYDSSTNTDAALRARSFRLVSYTNAKMFRSVPQLDLRANPNAGASGQLVGVITFNTNGNTFVSVLQLVCVDDGPTNTSAGSQNTSPVASFTLTVTSNNNPPNVQGIRRGDKGEPPPIVNTTTSTVSTLEDQVNHKFICSTSTKVLVLLVQKYEF
jgi:hypothetical protein